MATADTSSVSLSEELRSATAMLRVAFESALGGPRSPENRLIVALAGQVADWLESWDGVDLREDGPLPDDFAFALKVARAVNNKINEKEEVGHG